MVLLSGVGHRAPMKMIKQHSLSEGCFPGTLVLFFLLEISVYFPVSHHIIGILYSVVNMISMI